MNYDIGRIEQTPDVMDGACRPMFADIQNRVEAKIVTSLPSYPSNISRTSRVGPKMSNQPSISKIQTFCPQNRKNLVSDNCFRPRTNEALCQMHMPTWTHRQTLQKSRLCGRKTKKLWEDSRTDSSSKRFEGLSIRTYDSNFNFLKSRRVGTESGIRSRGSQLRIQSKSEYCVLF